MTNFDFSVVGIDKWVDKIDDELIRVMRRAAQITGHRIIAETPIDTGFLLSTMRVGATIQASGEEKKRPRGYNNPGVESQKINAVTKAAKGLKKGGSFTIEFQANYAKFAHDGTSAYGGYFYVSRVVRYWNSIFVKARAEVG